MMTRLNYSFFDRNDDFERELSDFLGEEVLKHRFISRLKGVSYLGTLDYSLRIPPPLRYSRYDHVLGVAYLTLKYCRNLSLPELETYLSVLVALIHDIGHGPFAHSIEFLQWMRGGARYKFGHHSNLKTSKIESFLRDCFGSFPKYVQEEYYNKNTEGKLTELTLRIDRIGRGIKTQSSIDVEKVFNNPFCPDTFEGVNRACQSLSRILDLEVSDPERLLEEVSAQGEPLIIKSKEMPGDNHPLMMFHLQMKHLYEEVIDSPQNRAAEAMLTRAATLAYSSSKKIPYSTLKDSNLISRLRENDASRYFWESLEQGELFEPLSLVEPKRYADAVNTYYKQRYSGSDLRTAFLETEKYVSKHLHLSRQYIIPHLFRTLKWDRSNIYFKRAGSEKWEIKWKPSEGTFNPKPIIEIYVPKKPWGYKQEKLF